MINPQVAQLTQSSTLQITALTKKLIKEGKDVVNFAAGEPDFDTPSFIKDAAKKAIDEGLTKYTPSSGTLDLREAIAKKLIEENKIPTEAKNIIVTAGAKYAIYVAILALIKKGEEVLVPSPFWVSYPEMVKLTNGKTKFIKTSQRDNFKLTPEKLQKSLNKKSKLLILNYPANPTGVTYTRKELEDIYSIIKDKNIFVLSDEIYEKLIYDNTPHVSFASIPGAEKITITINGFSKAFSMTGWRMGYLAADGSIVNEISKIIDHTTSCASSISQVAAKAALADKIWPEDMRKEFEKRRNLLYNGLCILDKIKPMKPQGSFYMFCDIKKSGLSAADFSAKLLEKNLVSTIPAESFGIDGFIRLSFATSCEEIQKGIERIKTFLSQLG